MSKDLKLGNLPEKIRKQLKKDIARPKTYELNFDEYNLKFNVYDLNNEYDPEKEYVYDIYCDGKSLEIKPHIKIRKGAKKKDINKKNLLNKKRKRKIKEKEKEEVIYIEESENPTDKPIDNNALQSNDNNRKNSLNEVKEKKVGGDEEKKENKNFESDKK